MSVSDAYREAINKMRAARGMGPAFRRASDPEPPDIFDAGDDDNNEPKSIEEAADLIRGFGRRRNDDKPIAPEGSVARFSSTALQGRAAKSRSPPNFRRLRSSISAP